MDKLTVVGARCGAPNVSFRIEARTPLPLRHHHVIIDRGVFLLPTSGTSGSCSPAAKMAAAAALLENEGKK